MRVLVSKSKRVSRGDRRYRAYVPLDREGTVVWVRVTPDVLNRVSSGVEGFEYPVYLAIMLPPSDVKFSKDGLLWSEDGELIERLARLFGVEAHPVSASASMGPDQSSPKSEAKGIIVDDQSIHRVRCPFCGHEDDYSMASSTRLVLPDRCQGCGAPVTRDPIEALAKEMDTFRLEEETVFLSRDGEGYLEGIAVSAGGENLIFWRRLDAKGLMGEIDRLLDGIYSAARA